MKTHLSGIKEIMNYVRRAWPTIRRWIKYQNFPARKMEEYHRKMGHKNLLPDGENNGGPDPGPESRLHAKCVKYCDERGWPYLSFQQSVKAKGFLRPGWPDLTIFKPGNEIVLIELKSAKGVLRKEQKELKLQLHYLGHHVHVVKSYKKFLEIVQGNEVMEYQEFLKGKVSSMQGRIKEQRIDISPADTMEVTCKACGGELFDVAVRLRTFPALSPKNPTGKDQVITIQTFICRGCGHEVGKAVPAEIEAK